MSEQGVAELLLVTTFLGTSFATCNGVPEAAEKRVIERFAASASPLALARDTNLVGQENRIVSYRIVSHVLF